LAAESLRGLETRLQKTNIMLESDQAIPYKKRLDREIGVINQMGFPGYFLIVADFIRWARNNDVPVGPGRGSGAGSLVAYVLGITDLDPLEHELLFERFLNPERVSMPDFDIDFCMEGRDRVIDYVAQKYGRHSVSQIITFGTMAARAVVRDVGRVLGFGYGHIDTIAKLIPFEIGMTLEKALQVEDMLRTRYETEDETRQLIDLAKKLEGISRNAGKHAGGVVIAPGHLTDFTGIYCEQDSTQIVTQFDKDDVETVGLVKFDFLGLRTLTIIKWAVDIANTRLKTQGQALIDISLLPMADEKTFALLKACQTHAVFQLESRGMRDLIKRLQPDCFEEIVALVALFRPGPLQSGMVDDFIDRKHGRATVEYAHPDLEPILKSTYGVILYQEQVMQIAQVLAGYTLGGADILRRAMGKKKPEEMAEQRAIFTAGALARDIDARLSNSIFDLMEKFAGYGFNRSHSAAYALVAYQTAWLKAHYPAALMAAVLSSDMDNTDKMVSMVSECRAMNLTVHLPSVNHSFYQFTVNDQLEIVYGLGAIKGVGQAAMEGMLSIRERDGVFTDLFHFCEQTHAHKINRRTLEALIKAGAMDCFEVDRATLLGSVNKAIGRAEQKRRDVANKQGDLFATLTHNADNGGDYVTMAALNKSQVLQGEKEVLGWYASGHPIERYEAELAYMTTATIDALKPTKDQMIVVAGLVSAIRTMNTKRGNRMAFITLDDNRATIELAVFSESYEEYRDLLVKDQLIIVEGDVSVDEYSGGYRMSARKVYDINTAREMYARAILLDFQSATLSAELLQQLQAILLPHIGGTCPVRVTYANDKAKATVKMGDRWRVTPTDDLLDALRLTLGESGVKVGY
jgi:DNA polymerase III subunit alpha